MPRQGTKGGKLRPMVEKGRKAKTSTMIRERRKRSGIHATIMEKIIQMNQSEALGMNVDIIDVHIATWRTYSMNLLYYPLLYIFIIPFYLFECNFTYFYILQLK